MGELGAAGESPADVRLQITYVPRPGLTRLTITNLLLNLITLFVYRFWAKTRVRRHVWSCVHINGEPLEYTGTGKELFLGAMIVLVVFILPLVLLAVGATLWFGQQHPVAGAMQFLGTAMVLLLTGFAIYRARRYRLSRTTWRGIRGALIGSAVHYTLIYFGSFLLKGLTLGWSTPAMNTELQKRIVSNMYFGDAAFSFRGSAGPLYPAYALSWFGVILLGVVLLGAAAVSYWFMFIARLFEDNKPSGIADWVGSLLILAAGGLLIYVVYLAAWSVYQAKEYRAFTAYTSFGRANFKLDARALSLFSLWVGNLLIVVLTIGVFWPFVFQRNIRYFCDRLTIEGGVPLASIKQSKQPMLKRGEGLAQAFDIDGF
jgi:uncharacterized membrane protein YjgN (DUF898 family)